MGGKKAAASGKASSDKAQPAISSFFATRPTQARTQAQQATPPPPADDDDDGDVVLVQSPAKKPRLEPSPGCAANPPRDGIEAAQPSPAAGGGAVNRAPPPPAISPAQAAELHRRFVNKLGSQLQANAAAQRTVDATVVLTASSPLYGPSSGPGGAYTPMERQILGLKRAHPGVLLMIEVGYKWRFFLEDAQSAHEVLHLVAYNDRNLRVAGGPTHRGDHYLRRLCEAGHKVGVVRQTETAALKAASDSRSKLFERRLVQVYTAATLGACSSLDGSDNSVLIGGSTSYLVTIVEDGSRIALLGVEASTGDVLYAEFQDSTLRAALEGHLLTLPCGELLLGCNRAAGQGGQLRLSAPTEKVVAGLYGCTQSGGCTTRLERCDVSAWAARGGALAAVTEEFYSDAEPAHLQALLQLPELVVTALASALSHLKGFNLNAVLKRAAAFRDLEADTHMTLPPNALRQLDVLVAAGATSASDGRRGSLLWLLDHTLTPGGKRALHRWTSRPLRSAVAIEQRLEAVAALHDEDDATGATLRPVLKRLPDVERCLTRSLHRTVTPGDFVTTLAALTEASSRLQALSAAVPDGGLLHKLLSLVGDPAVAAEAAALLACLDTAAARASPPDMARLFRPSGAAAAALTFPAVDAARSAIKGVEAQLTEQLRALQKSLRVPSLQFVKVADVEYLIELPELLPVPKGWLKHSQLKTRKVIRWQVPEVTELVQALERGREELHIAATAAWGAFLTRVSASYATLRVAADSLSQLDALQSLAVVARNEGYCRPVVLGGPDAQLDIVSGRHPVLDALLNGGYVPNDTKLGNSDGDARCSIISGPNMGGKSSYVRSVALITIMAHIGSFVPAASARLSVCDSVLTRMGAADSLATGSSTFLEEMSETSAILRQATARSLVIIDELGRGTSTEDGLAIAHATLHHIVAVSRPLTLFVTHFPSVANDMRAALAPAVETQFVGWAGEGGAAADASVTFLYKLQHGVASRAFGINVARMAGVPAQVLACAATRAEEVERQQQSRVLATAEVASLRAALA
jgi:DNA mismatch repair protein MSH3